MVMEYLEGGDLAGWLDDHGPLPIEQAVEFILQASEAIAEAHALGIVHRDLKPANLFCIRRADGRLSVKVLDFGISKMTQFGATSGGPTAITQASTLIGSPVYMSPEQMKSAKTVDSQTDIWALGVILFEFLTGRLPFVADSLPELALTVTTGTPLPLREMRPEVPEALESVVLRCLERDRSRRYGNVAELGHALLPFAPARAKGSVDRISGIIQSSGLLATALSLLPSPNGGHAQTFAGTLPPFGRTTSGSSGRKKVAVVSGGVGAFLILVAIVSLAMWKRGFSHRGDSIPVAVPAVSPAVSPQVPVVDPGVSLTERANPSAPTVGGAVSTGPREPKVVPTSSRVAILPKPPVTVASKPTMPSPLSSARAVPSASSPSAISSSPSLNPNCDPTYYYDAEGNKHFKPECFGH
jgi:serine/threonine-protein kinase